MNASDLLVVRNTFALSVEASNLAAMSSSFKQKKLKTLATRKKTRKRRAQLGLTPEDDSGRLFQPPSKRDPRWKKPTLGALVAGVAGKRQKLSHPIGHEDEDEDGDDDGDDEDDEDEDDEGDEDEEEEEVDVPLNDEESEDDDGDVSTAAAAARAPLTLCSSLEDCVKRAEAKHVEIRRKDGRQKAKVLMLVDTQSLFKGIKTKMGVRAEPVRSKSRVGIRSVKQNSVAFRKIGALKTPMDRFHDANKEVLQDFKSGKLPSLLAEDTSFFPYSDLKLQHVIFVAKRAATLKVLDRSLLPEQAEAHFFLMNEGGSALSTEDREGLEEAMFELV